MGCCGWISLSPINQKRLLTLWFLNIAMGNGPFIDGLPITVKMVMFDSYVKLPEGNVFKLSSNS
jgi:hypothetical protein